LPDMPGFALVRTLQEALGKAGPKLALVASRRLFSTISEAERRGVVVTLLHPLRRARLWNAVAAAMGRAELQTRGHMLAGAEEMQPPTLDEARAEQATSACINRASRSGLSPQYRGRDGIGRAQGAPRSRVYT